MRDSELALARTRESSAAPATRILVVDDSERDVRAFEAVLQGLAESVVQARTGQEALARLLEDDYAVVLLDVRLPDMDGFEVAARIRSQRRHQNVPVIFVTGFESNRDDVDRAYELGAVDYVTKPVSATVLRSKVASFVELHRHRMDLERLVARRTADLRRANEELFDFFENGAVACHWVGPDGVILQANQAELAMMGYARDEYVGRHIAEFHVRQDVIDDILRRLRANEVLREHPAQLRTKDGSIRDVLVDSSALWKDGVFIHSRCFTRDVTDLRRAQEDQKRLVAVLESSDDAIITKTCDGTITSWNRGAERMFGYTAQETIGRPITLLIPEALRAEEGTILSRLMRGEKILHYETRRQAKDGRVLDISLTISPLRDADGRIVGAFKVARDITPRVSSEREIRRLNAHLETLVRDRTAELTRTVKELDAFAYTVAHDLRAPLRGIHGASFLLLEDHADGLSPEGRDLASRIVESSKRMDLLITDLLSYCHLGRQDIPLSQVSLSGIVSGALRQVEHELKTRDAQVEVQEPLLDVFGNELILGQAVSNLVSNAAKFVASGVRPRVRIRSERGDRGVRLWVEDNGIGIAPEHVGRLFKVFERLHAASEYPGTGIGLAIVKRIMDRIGGRAGVESEPGNGSRFWLEIPAPARSAS